MCFSDVDGVILLIIEFLPACGAVVSPGEGVTDALTAEQMAALGGDHEPSALDDLEKINKIFIRVSSSFSVRLVLDPNIRPHQSFTKKVCKCL